MTYAVEERRIQQRLAKKAVLNMWNDFTPAQIARRIKMVDPTLRMTARWVEGIRRRVVLNAKAPRN